MAFDDILGIPISFEDKEVEEDETTPKKDVWDTEQFWSLDLNDIWKAPDKENRGKIPYNRPLPHPDPKSVTDEDPPKPDPKNATKNEDEEELDMADMDDFDFDDDNDDTEPVRENPKGDPRVEIGTIPTRNDLIPSFWGEGYNCILD